MAKVLSSSDGGGGGTRTPTTPSAGGASRTLAIAGMDCASCAKKVEKALRSLDGVEDVHTDVVGERVTVKYAKGQLTYGDLVGAVQRTGYTVKDGSPGQREGFAAAGISGGDDVPVAQLWWRRDSRLLLAGLSGILWAGSLLSENLLDAGSLAAALALGAIVSGGWYIVPRGVRAGLNRALDMNFLMSVAALGALAIGEYGEAASAIFLFAVAQLLESYSMDRVRASIKALMDLSPAEATVLRGGREERIAADLVQVGDTVVVRPGEKIPVDGEVLAGRSSVNQAAITGESVPVDREEGEEVFAGTLNGEGALEVRSTRPSSDTTLARIIHSVQEAQASRAPSQTFVDRFARVYTPVVVAVAVLVAILPPLVALGTWGEWFYRALVLLVVACPCALVISTPVTVVSALAGAAQRGILIKGGLHLENAGRARVVTLDKTGTLTEGEPAVADVIAFGGSDSETILALAAAAEARSEHPLARAILRHAEAKGVSVERASDTRATTGKGVQARVDGRVVHVGSERRFAEWNVLDASVRSTLAKVQERGQTAVLVGSAPVKGSDAPDVLGAIAIADRVRPDAADALRRLRAAGIRRIVMLTGDHRATAAAVAAQLGVDDYRAELLPEDKVEAVRLLRSEHGRVLMVGDGVNDAPALAAADVGVAMGSAGTDVALETADIALMADDLSKLATTIRLARKAERIIRANIWFSLLTKAVFVLLAVLGFATLWMAVIADMGASLLVVMNGLRALRE